jgi:ADP-ribosylglycohydrolase
MKTLPNKKERFLGCLVGLATGDALGAPYEWCKTPFTATDMIGGGSHGLKPGAWTDDTSMALCLAESLIEKKAFDSKNQLIKYLAWVEKGHLSVDGTCVGIGRTTRQSIAMFKACGDITPRHFDFAVCGNGSIMRLASVPMFYYNHKRNAISFSSESSKTTHIHPSCLAACQMFGEMLWKALHGQSKKEILTFKHKYHSPEIGDIAKNKTYNLEPPYIEGTGHVTKSLEAAMWAFKKSRSFKHGALLAVNLGADADTTAAVYGQLAGAYYGYNNIPKSWKNRLIKRDLIEQYATSLYNLSK